MWTVNVFLVYEMIYDWNTYEKLGSLYCMENSKVFTPTNCSKIFFLLPPKILVNPSQIQKE